MMSLWDEEEADARERRDQHWAEVLAQQASVRKLRGEKEQLEREKLQEDSAAGNRSLGDSQRSAARSRSVQLHQQIQNKGVQIDHAKVPPAPVLQPLPAERIKAMAVIFFLKMPRHFQALSRLSFMAQQMLVPGACEITIPAADQGEAFEEQVIDISRPIERPGPATSWRDYYTSQSSGPERQAELTMVKLGALEQLPDKFGPKDVMQYSSRDDGVWHPDHLEPCLFWDGGVHDLFALDRRDGAFFDPFAPLSDEAVVRWFTETLPDDRVEMQWVMGSTYGKSLTRGNEAIAFQAFRPPWLAPSEFLAMGALRSFPRQQFRKLCVALHERSLPLGDPAVRALMLQTLFHVGELECTDAGWRLAWWGDVGQHCDGWETLHGELAFLAVELREKPSENAVLLLLAQVCAYLICTT